MGEPLVGTRGQIIVGIGCCRVRHGVHWRAPPMSPRAGGSARSANATSFSEVVTKAWPYGGECGVAWRQHRGAVTRRCGKPWLWDVAVERQEQRQRFAALLTDANSATEASICHGSKRSPDERSDIRVT